MLRLLFSLLPLALLLGCPTAAPVTTEEPQCPRPVDASPAPSGAEVFAKDVFVTWDDVPEDPSLLVLIDGAELAGTVTTEDEGRTLRWTPETPLPPVTQVDVAAAQSCADEVAFGFTTGRWGLPLDDSEALPDATFHLDIGSGSVVAPEGVGPIVQALLREDTLLLSVLPGSDLDGGPVHVRAAKSTRGRSVSLRVRSTSRASRADCVPAAWMRAAGPAAHSSMLHSRCCCACCTAMSVRILGKRSLSRLDRAAVSS